MDYLVRQPQLRRSLSLGRQYSRDLSGARVSTAHIQSPNNVQINRYATEVVPENTLLTKNVEIRTLGKDLYGGCILVVRSIGVLRSREYWRPRVRGQLS
jgi:hypothetical protein